jgi:hypoxanthine phosphoribosyltransferase
MNGAFMFFSDLIREIQLDVRTKFIYAKSYAGTKQQDLSLMYEELDFAELEGQHVVIVEDIVDTGGTILGVIEAVQRFNPKKVELCTLLLRNPKSIISIDHYVGFLLDNEEFIIGYGLDLDSKFRNVAFITTIDEIKAAPYSYLHKYI